MTEKVNVAVLYGGKSTEHEVSVHSAQTVCDVLEKTGKYALLRIFIDKQGFWFLQQTCAEGTDGAEPVTPVLSRQGTLYVPARKEFLRPDVFFPVLHGTNGEDGTVQGLLETLCAPYVGCGVLASAMAMDKEVAKVAAWKRGIPVLPYKKLSRGVTYDNAALEAWAAQTGFPVFVKPLHLGSSVGVSKVKTAGELRGTVDFAFRFDTDVMIEKGIENPREVFCGLLGHGEQVYASECGELKTLQGEFFDYQAKYVTAGGCETRVPADLPAQTRAEMRQYSEVIFKALRGSGLARVDFLVDGTGKAWFSEINTIPGLSLTSLYPQLFEASGWPYPQLLCRLVDLALAERAEKDRLCLERAE